MRNDWQVREKKDLKVGPMSEQISAAVPLGGVRSRREKEGREDTNTKSPLGDKKGEGIPSQTSIGWRNSPRGKDPIFTARSQSFGAKEPPPGEGETPILHNWRNEVGTSADVRRKGGEDDAF